MTTRRVDVAIIGAGTAGLTARRGALKAGAKEVVMIEGGVGGTTCARVGCMPSKLLIAAAEAAHAIDAAEVFGLRSASYEVDGRAVMGRVQRERDRFTGFVHRSVDAMPADQVLRGWAKLSSAKTLTVTTSEGETVDIEADAIVIAAGTRPWIQPSLRSLGSRLLTNEEIFELETLPRSIAIVGTGVIGLELGQAFTRLGVRTAVFNRSRKVGPLKDETLQDLSREIFAKELDLHLGAADLAGEPVDDGARLTWTDAEGHAREEVFEYVLAATGRRPHFEALGFDTLGLELDARGYPPIDHRTMQVADLPIFIAGDIAGEHGLLHEAADEGRIAGKNAARFPDVRAEVRRTPIGITFSDPNIAYVGADVGGLDPARHAFGEVDYGDQGRARVMAQHRGRVRIWGEMECGVLVAAEMIGPRVEHTAHLLAWAIQQRMTVEQALAMPFYHPVVEEGIRTALRNLSQAIQHGGGRVDCTPGT